MKRILALQLLACLAISSADANPITQLNVGLTSPYVLGEAIFNGDHSLVPSGGQATRDLTMVNQLVGINNGTLLQAAPYFRSANSFGGTLSTAATAGDVIASMDSGTISFATDGNVSILLGSGYSYLIAAYDNKNSGAVVWDISGIAAGTTIELPANVLPINGGTDLSAGDKYGITTWSLFKGSIAPNGVPDGGLTIVLLGSALTCLGLLRLKLG